MIAQTRLPAKLVASFEVDDTTALPDRAYALQYVRAVGQAIGLDPEEVALRYEEWLGTLPPATLPPPPIQASTPGEKAVAGARKLASLPRRISTDPVVWAVLLLTLAAIWFVLRKR